VLLLDKLKSLGPVMRRPCAALNCELAMVVVVVLGAVVVDVQPAHRGLEVGVPAGREVHGQLEGSELSYPGPEVTRLGLQLTGRGATDSRAFRGIPA
jgi:hypothetical protein